MQGGKFPATLSGKQITDIVRLRLGGLQYKKIALIVQCTPAQARAYWRTSTAYRPQANLAVAQKKRHAKTVVAALQARQAKALQQQLSVAKALLRQEIAQAVAEAAQAPTKLFKVGDLVW